MKCGKLSKITQKLYETQDSFQLKLMVYGLDLSPSVEGLRGKVD